MDGPLFAFGGVVCTLIGAAIGYMAKHHIERRKEHIGMEIESKALENAKRLLELHEMAEAKGIEITTNFKYLNVIHEGMTREDLLNAIRQVCNLWLQNAFHASNWMEQVWSEHPEYAELLGKYHAAYGTAYKFCTRLQIPVKPDAIKPVLDAYTEYCVNPNDDTAAKVGEAYMNVDWRELRRQSDELTKDDDD